MEQCNNVKMEQWNNGTGTMEQWNSGTVEHRSNGKMAKCDIVMM